MCTRSIHRSVQASIQYRDWRYSTRAEDPNAPRHVPGASSLRKRRKAMLDELVVVHRRLWVGLPRVVVCEIEVRLLRFWRHSKVHNSTYPAAGPASRPRLATWHNRPQLPMSSAAIQPKADEALEGLKWRALRTWPISGGGGPELGASLMSVAEY